MADDAIHATRVCRKCGVEKPADRVHFPPVGKSIRPQCRPCWRDHEREYFWANREAKRESARRARAKQDKALKREKLNEWRAANPDKVRATDLRRLAKIKADPAERAKVAARMKAWRERNPERDRERRRAMRERDPGATARYCRAYRERYPDKVREKGRAWREKNPAKVIAYSEMRRERVRAAEGDITEEVVIALMRSSDMICFYCDKPLIKFEVDHFIPITRGGTNLPDNLRMSCSTCNRRKSNKLPWEWMPERFAPPD